MAVVPSNSIGPRNWVFLFDGTRASKESKEPSVISIIDELVANDPWQITRYWSGVGTGHSTGAHFLGGITGRGLHAKVRKAFDFLARNYHEGDELIFAGFSRGGFTCMVLSAFLDRVGIPKDRSNQTFRMLWKKFENRELEDPQVCRELKKRFKCIEAPVNLLLCLDAVAAEGSPRTGALGLFKYSPSRYKKLGFCLSELPSNVLKYRHILALHEFRSPFMPVMIPIARDIAVDALQVWLPGSHHDIGRGTDTLIWTIAQLMSSGVKFDTEALERRFPGFSMFPDLQDPAAFGNWRTAELHPTWKKHYKFTGYKARVPGMTSQAGTDARETIHIRARYRDYGLTVNDPVVIPGHAHRHDPDGRVYWHKRGQWSINGTWSPRAESSRESSRSSTASWFSRKTLVNRKKIPEADVDQIEAKLTLCLAE